MFRMMKKRFRKRAAVQVSILVLAGLCGTMLPLQTSCIKEDMANCKCKALLYIVADREGADKADDPDGATVFLFNSDRTYSSFIQVSAEDMAEGKAVPVSYSCDNLLWVSVWGNLGDSEEVSPLILGTGMGDMYVAMIKDSEGYAVAMDYLFFGAKQLSGEAEDHVVISPKTGRIAITVKGLQDYDPDRYFFTVNTPYSRYDFAGNPLPAQATLRFSGVFRGSDLVTAEPYHLVHFPSLGADGGYLVVELYRRNSESDEPQLLATASKDIHNQPIAILRGKTTNVLIAIASQGGVEVSVRITDWDEVINQWDEW